MRIEKGIYDTPHGYRVAVRVRTKLHSKRFKKTASFEEMRRWRTRMKQRDPWPKLGWAEKKKLSRAPEGWCYLYAIRSGDYVKFGRAVDPHGRLADLQCASPIPLQLMAAVPVHGHAEMLAHRKFDHARAHGEWFRLEHDIVEFIVALNDGKNPVALLWDATIG